MQPILRAGECSVHPVRSLRYLPRSPWGRWGAVLACCILLSVPNVGAAQTAEDYDLPPAVLAVEADAEPRFDPPTPLAEMDGRQWAWKRPAAVAEQEERGNYRLAAVTETDYNLASFADQRRKGEGGSSLWDTSHQAAWQVLAWVWVCGAVVAALVYVTYRNMALRQMQQLSSPQTSPPLRGVVRSGGAARSVKTVGAETRQPGI